jgi:phosphopantetheine--protein transferase-like protein
LVGVDVVDIERLRAVLVRAPRIEMRLFSEAERAYCRSHVDPVVSFAGTLAAKEAVIKALELGSLAGCARRVEITRSPSGAPRASVQGHDVHVSISHDGPVAIAAALVTD